MIWEKLFAWENLKVSVEIISLVIETIFWWSMVYAVWHAQESMSYICHHSNRVHIDV